MAPNQSLVWRPEDADPPVAETPGSEIFRPDILDEIEKKIGEISKELNELSLDIHGVYSTCPRMCISDWLLYSSQSRAEIWGTVRDYSWFLLLSVTIYAISRTHDVMTKFISGARIRSYKALSPTHCLAGDIQAWPRGTNHRSKLRGEFVGFFRWLTPPIFPCVDGCSTWCRSRLWSQCAYLVKWDFTT